MFQRCIFSVFSIHFSFLGTAVYQQLEVQYTLDSGELYSETEIPDILESRELCIDSHPRSIVGFYTPDGIADFLYALSPLHSHVLGTLIVVSTGKGNKATKLVDSRLYIINEFLSPSEYKDRVIALMSIKNSKSQRSIRQMNILISGSLKDWNALPSCALIYASYVLATNS